MSANTTADSDPDVIWSLNDYALYVPMSDAFYQSLQFQRVTLKQLQEPNCPKQAIYRDSRTYLGPILEHLIGENLTPDLLDVGGYIGRFSIEATLLARSMQCPLKTTCFEPGETFTLLEKNFALNEVEEQIQLVAAAVSDKKKVIRFAIPDDAMITSRVVADHADITSWGSRWRESSIEAVPLGEYLSADTQAFVCKIDTEGHEAKVIAGIGQRKLECIPHVLIVEFWPSLLKEKLFGRNFQDYIIENYRVFDIRNSLYPAHFQLLEDFDRISAMINSGEANNRDIMLVSKSVPEQNQLTQRLLQLATH